MTFFNLTKMSSHAMAAGLTACLLLLTACESTGPSVQGDPRDKVIAAYGQPDARQTNHNIEVWQYCTPRKADESLDKLHLVWLMDGVVVRESRHDYDLDRCQRLYVVDLGAPPQPS